MLYLADGFPDIPKGTYTLRTINKARVRIMLKEGYKSLLYNDPTYMEKDLGMELECAVDRKMPKGKFSLIFCCNQFYWLLERST